MYRDASALRPYSSSSYIAISCKGFAHSAKHRSRTSNLMAGLSRRPGPSARYPLFSNENASW
ncbi:hypothetical protein EV356DRAFT_141067 [Viridothelium virens]|uniref:Uncharacterized protein n=1 Tax=Viridothelium virens TaxID=1048519 RepID=A0A6A6H9C4_VIRVR|nr:hypothetical protein EV356DRAFT_141067 [Viridothelium virens]